MTSKNPYPLWTVECRLDGFVCTVWEKPGTGCSYIKRCPECGITDVTTTKVTSKEEHEKAIDRANREAGETNDSWLEE